jgi:hypothetical protein
VKRDRSSARNLVASPTGFVQRDETTLTSTRTHFESARSPLGCARTFVWPRRTSGLRRSSVLRCSGVPASRVSCHAPAFSPTWSLQCLGILDSTLEALFCARAGTEARPC